MFRLESVECAYRSLSKGVEERVDSSLSHRVKKRVDGTLGTLNDIVVGLQIFTHHLSTDVVDRK